MIATIPAGTHIGYGSVAILKVESPLELPETGLGLLVGRNGQGKTTFLKYLAGCLETRPSEKFTRVYLPEDLLYAGFLTPRSIAKAFCDRQGREYFEDASRALELDMRKPFRDLSKGNRQKVRLIQSLAVSHENDVAMTLLDEPLSGLDYAVRKEAWTRFYDAAEKRLVLASLHPDTLPRPPDYVFAVSQGRISQLEGSFRSWAEIEEELVGRELALP